VGGRKRTAEEMESSKSEEDIKKDHIR